MLLATVVLCRICSGMLSPLQRLLKVAVWGPGMARVWTEGHEQLHEAGRFVALLLVAAAM